jgi:hypothetical protein
VLAVHVGVAVVHTEQIDEIAGTLGLNSTCEFNLARFCKVCKQAPTRPDTI